MNEHKNNMQFIWLQTDEQVTVYPPHSTIINIAKGTLRLLEWDFVKEQEKKHTQKDCVYV